MRMRNNMTRAIVTLLLLGCSLMNDAAARDLQQVLNTKTLRVGVTLFPPWAARAANGELVGFEADVARQLAADLKVKVDLRAYDIERLIPALESGEIDLIAAGLTITPARALHVNFSQPYAEGGVGLATHVARTANVKKLEDLDGDSHTIVAVEGSVAAQLARRVLPRAKLRIVASADAASRALISGEVDGYLEDEPVPTFLALDNPGVVDVPLPRPLLASRSGFAVNKGDPDFLAFLNAWIVAHDADTWLPTTASYWFKSLRWRERLGNAPAR
jgi:polar amino acid transport system substrate-binding protein